MQLSLKGLEMAPSQIWQAIRLVPILDPEPESNLRLSLEKYRAPYHQVNLPGQKLAYYSYIPYGLIVNWTESGAAVVPRETQLAQNKLKAKTAAFHIHDKLVKQQGKNQMRFLPLHLAMESFLAHHFNAPDILWKAYSEKALRLGLSPRWEWVLPADALIGLKEALRTFEIYEQQVGMLAYIGDSLITALVVSHPEDYRQLHDSILMDFVPFFLHTFCGYNYGVQEHRVHLDEAQIHHFSDLRRALHQAEQEILDFQAQVMAQGLLKRKVEVQPYYEVGPFTLSRFITDLQSQGENHIGEIMTDDSGKVRYLKTYRLSPEQIDRARILSDLSAHDWHPRKTAEGLNMSYPAFLKRLIKLHLADLINENHLKEMLKPSNPRDKSS